MVAWSAMRIVFIAASVASCGVADSRPAKPPAYVEPGSFQFLSAPDSSPDAGAAAPATTPGPNEGAPAPAPTIAAPSSAPLLPNVGEAQCRSYVTELAHVEFRCLVVLDPKLNDEEVRRAVRTKWLKVGDCANSPEAARPLTFCLADLREISCLDIVDFKKKRMARVDWMPASCKGLWNR